jgi:hypothetical protein
MTRLVAAILILFAVLIGLKAANSSLFQTNLFGQGNNATPQTRNTGFSSAANGAATSNSGVSSGGLNAPSQVNTANQLAPTGTTPLPPRGSQAAVRAGW